MPASLYTETVLALMDKLSLVVAKRNKVRATIADLDDEIYKLRQGIFGLCALIESQSEYDEIKKKHPEVFEDLVDPRLGITDAVRQALKAKGEFMPPTEVRDAVVRLSSVLDSHKNPLGSIHTVLKRLVDSNEVTTVIADDGKTMYGWTGDEQGRKRLAKHLNKDDADVLLKRDKEKAKRSKDAEKN